MWSQANLEHWHWVQVTFPIYPWLPLPSGRAMPAITSPLLVHPIYPGHSCQLPSKPPVGERDEVGGGSTEHVRDDKKGGLKMRRIYRENERAKERWKDCVVEMAREETEIKKMGLTEKMG